MIQMFSSVAAVLPNFFSDGKEDRQTKLGLDKLKKNAELNNKISKVKKYYEDLNLKNLLKENLSKLSANYGAYNISSSKGSAKAARNRIINFSNLDNEKRQKLFDLNVEKTNSNYNFAEKANLLNNLSRTNKDDMKAFERGYSEFSKVILKYQEK